MESKWKEIWNKRAPDVSHLESTDPEQVFLELKRIDGFDILPTDGAAPWKAQHAEILRRLGRYHKPKSVFDVGCGSGANLYLFHQAGLEVGGLDYSQTLIDVLRRVLPPETLRECACAEAAALDTTLKYDAMIANSVFSYFPDTAYAERVLTKMLQKANYCVGLVDVHDAEKEADFLAYRRRIIADYDERYRGLPKLFYDRAFFTDIAEKNNCELVFAASTVEGYWNNDFIYNCFFYKRQK